MYYKCYKIGSPALCYGRTKNVLIRCMVIMGSMLLCTPAYSVELYGVYETSVVNNTTFTNPFNFQEVELQAVFTAPSGKVTNFIGFHDGNGLGGQTGNVWKLRFMPNETGNWSYTYSWSNGSAASGSGSFNVTDVGVLRGPLEIAEDNSWYFQDARGEPFHWRGYDISYLPANQDHMDWGDTAPQNYISVINSHVIARQYNFLMLQHPSYLGYPRVWWVNSQKGVYDVFVWQQFEKIVRYCLQNNIYVIPFVAMASQNGANMIDNNLIKYIAARFGAFANYMGYTPTWEYYDVFSDSQIDTWMTFLQNILPSQKMLTVHDRAKSGFTSWQGFHMRQGGDDGVNRSIFTANDRSLDVDSSLMPFNKPIIGSEDIWESPDGIYGYARNATEVRRTAWGEIMAGVMPLYSEWTSYIFNAAPSKLGNGSGESEVRRMYDFVYSQTKYRQYSQLNSLVSSAAGQIASGIPGVEYLVFDTDGGSISISLNDLPQTTLFSVLWFDPKNGATTNAGTVSGGGVLLLNSPITGESVLLLRTTNIATVVPIMPINFSVTVSP